MRALVLLRDSPPYRVEAFISGLERMGYAISTTHIAGPCRDDVLVIWNKYGANEALARQWKQAGARIIICENGYFGREWRGGFWYAMALDNHQGAGEWFPGDGSRWSSWDYPLKEWRRQGDKILVLAQRGIGCREYRQPHGWCEAWISQLTKTTRRPIHLRAHPGNVTRDTLLDELEGAHAVFTWASSGGIKAIAAGIPVFHGLGTWIGAPAARTVKHDLEDPYLGARVPMFERLAWAQWELKEIEQGLPFDHLLC